MYHHKAIAQLSSQARASCSRLMCVQGMCTLATLGWSTAMRFLFSRAPISYEDIGLWMVLLPILSRIAGSPAVCAADLLLLAEEFIGGSALQWLGTLSWKEPDQKNNTAECKLMQVRHWWGDAVLPACSALCI